MEMDSRIGRDEASTASQSLELVGRTLELSSEGLDAVSSCIDDDLGEEEEVKLSNDVGKIMEKVSELYEKARKIEKELCESIINRCSHRWVIDHRGRTVDMRSYEMDRVCTKCGVVKTV